MQDRTDRADRARRAARDGRRLNYRLAGTCVKDASGAAGAAALSSGPCGAGHLHQAGPWKGSLLEFRFALKSSAAQSAADGHPVEAGRRGNLGAKDTAVAGEAV
jgi:hypothetical protein